MKNQNWVNEYLKDFLSPRENNFRKSYDIKRKHMPSKIYKYRIINSYSKECLSNQTVWCTTLDSYNDPYEGYINIEHFDIYKKKLLNYAKKLPQNLIKRINETDSENKLIELFENEPELSKLKKLYFSDKNITRTKIKEQIIKNQKSNKICSFSALKPYSESLNDDIYNRLMWAHYGSEHKGFCIEYETSQCITDLYPVIYSSKMLDISDYFSAVTEHKNVTSMLPYYSLMCKDIVWKYENEWRLIFINDEPNECSLKPSALYFGAKMSAQDKNTMKNIAKKINIPFFEIITEGNNYRLLKKQVF